MRTIMRTYVLLLIAASLLLLAGCQAGPGTEQAGDSTGNSIIDTYYDLPAQARALYLKQSDGLQKEVPERLIELDQLKIGCFGPSNVMRMSPADGNLGGQCCGALTDIEAYELQLEAISNFIAKNGNIDFIPRDPYDMTVEHAQRLTAWEGISLTAQQQTLYDAAIEMSHHGGPCCCKCWKWYVMSGLAKKLIVDYGWDEHQIAELWDISSSCGHSHDTDMHKHYRDHLGDETSPQDHAHPEGMSVHDH